MTATRNLDWIVGKTVTKVTLEGHRLNIWFDNGVWLYLSADTFVERPRTFIVAQQYKDGEDWKPETTKKSNRKKK